MKPLVRVTIALLGIALLGTACSQSTDSGSTTTVEPSTPAASSQSSSAAPEPSLPPAEFTPIVAAVVAAPIPVRATDGKVHLAYELQLTNMLGSDVTLNSVSVNAGDDTLLTLAGEDLAYWTRIVGASPSVPTTSFGAAQAGIVWLDVVVDEGAPPPTELIHTIDVTLSKPAPPLLPPTMSETVAPVLVSDQQPVTIAPPLRGPNWLNGSSCCDMTSHRTAVNPIGGALWAAERFAIDYVQLSADGTIFAGDNTKPEDYPYFGADIVAVADGPVVAVMEGLPEQVAGKSPTGLPLDQYGGNHVVQDISGGGTEKRYAFYAHLKTGSTKVKVGDQLTTGQVIANLGNTGNSDAPHLHFHVMSTPDPLRSNGLPFVIDNYELTGQVASMSALDPLLVGKPAELKPNFAARAETDTSPLVLDVMDYADN